MGILRPGSCGQIRISGEARLPLLPPSVQSPWVSWYFTPGRQKKPVLLGTCPHRFPRELEFSLYPPGLSMSLGCCHPVSIEPALSFFLWICCSADLPGHCPGPQNLGLGFYSSSPGSSSHLPSAALPRKRPQEAGTGCMWWVPEQSGQAPGSVFW